MGYNKLTHTKRKGHRVKCSPYTKSLIQNSFSSVRLVHLGVRTKLPRRGKRAFSSTAMYTVLDQPLASFFGHSLATPCPLFPFPPSSPISPSFPLLLSLHPSIPLTPAQLTATSSSVWLAQREEYGWSLGASADLIIRVAICSSSPWSVPRLYGNVHTGL